MKIEHIAIWTNQLEVMKMFYSDYFGAVSNDIYMNSKTGFESYFLTFSEGSRLEIMSKPNLEEGHKAINNGFIGLGHFAVSVGSKDGVIELTERLRRDGYKVLSETRWTGDGYFESVISDPDGNRVEITI